MGTNRDVVEHLNANARRLNIIIWENRKS